MGKLNLDKARQKKEELERFNGDFNFWKPNNGRNLIRVLPPKGDSEEIGVETVLHFKCGPEANKTITCIGKRCPVCAYIEELKATGNKEDAKMASEMAPKKRTYLNIIDRDDETDEDGNLKVQVAGVGVTIYGGIIEVICDEDYGDITDFNEGHDVVITKTGNGMKTEYKVMPKPKTSLATDLINEEDLDDYLKDLDSLITVKTADEIVAILNGEDDDEPQNGEEEPEEQQEEEPVKKTNSRNPVRTPASSKSNKANNKEDDEADELQEQMRKELARKSGSAGKSPAARTPAARRK